MTQRAVARNPKPRTTIVRVVEGDYAGWECEARVDFPARWVADLQSGDFGRVLDVMGKIVVWHNFPDEDGKLAKNIADVDFTGLKAVMQRLTEAIAALPNR